KAVPAQPGDGDRGQVVDPSPAVEQHHLRSPAPPRHLRLTRLHRGVYPIGESEAVITLGASGKVDIDAVELGDVVVPAAWTPAGWCHPHLTIAHRLDDLAADDQVNAGLVADRRLDKVVHQPEFGQIRFVLQQRAHPGRFEVEVHHEYAAPLAGEMAGEQESRRRSTDTALEAVQGYPLVGRLRRGRPVTSHGTAVGGSQPATAYPPVLDEAEIRRVQEDLRREQA